MKPGPRIIFLCKRVNFHWKLSLISVLYSSSSSSMTSSQTTFLSTSPLQARKKKHVKFSTTHNTHDLVFEVWSRNKWKEELLRGMKPGPKPYSSIHCEPHLWKASSQPTFPSIPTHLNTTLFKTLTRTYLHIYSEPMWVREKPSTDSLIPH